MKNISRCFLIVAMAACGCGGASDAPQFADVEGTITWKGKPLSDAGVAFTPQSGPIAIGRTDEAGHFQLSTQGRPGAAVGSHRVTVDAYEPIPESKTHDPERVVKLISRIPVKFRELEKSGLEATVSSDAEKNQFSFALQD